MGVLFEVQMWRFIVLYKDSKDTPQDSIAYYWSKWVSHKIKVSSKSIYRTHLKVFIMKPYPILPFVLVMGMYSSC